MPWVHHFPFICYCLHNSKFSLQNIFKPFQKVGVTTAGQPSMSSQGFQCLACELPHVELNLPSLQKHFASQHGVQNLLSSPATQVFSSLIVLAHFFSFISGSCEIIKLPRRLLQPKSIPLWLRLLWRKWAAREGDERTLGKNSRRLLQAGLEVVFYFSLQVQGDFLTIPPSDES